MACKLQHHRLRTRCMQQPLKRQTMATRKVRKCCFYCLEQRLESVTVKVEKTFSYMRFILLDQANWMGHALGTAEWWLVGQHKVKDNNPRQRCSTITSIQGQVLKVSQQSIIGSIKLTTHCRSPNRPREQIQILAACLLILESCKFRAS
jgi:hypothetical protein